MFTTTKTNTDQALIAAFVATHLRVAIRNRKGKIIGYRYV